MGKFYLQFSKLYEFAEDEKVIVFVSDARTS